METNNEYHISFFKPTTIQAKRNRNLALMLIGFWAIAIFGFQILLRVFEEPTPEPSYITYEKVWTDVKAENASQAELQEFAKSTMAVLGKVMINPEDKAILGNGLNWAVFQLADSVQKVQIEKQVLAFEKLKAEITNIRDESYLKAKAELSLIVSPIINLSDKDVRAKLLPLELSFSQMLVFDAKNKELLPATMKKYLIHNQSFLTDFKLLGFPFHYFYTAVFLLILFVFLCWLYCIRIDKFNKLYNIED